jgi:hypothetical protein
MSLKNPVARTGIDTGTVRLVAQRLNHYATPGPLSLKACNKIKLWISACSTETENNGKIIFYFENYVASRVQKDSQARGPTPEYKMQRKLQVLFRTPTWYTLHFSLYWGSHSRHISGITCPSSGGTTQTQGWWLLCAVVDVGWSQDVGRRQSSHILRMGK